MNKFPQSVSEQKYCEQGTSSLLLRTGSTWGEGGGGGGGDVLM